MTDLPRDIEIELAALADGSLADERRAEALARVHESRELQTALAEQRRVVELTAAVDARAPESLHREVEAMLTPRSRAGEGSGTRRQPRLTRRWLVAPRVGAALAAVALIAAVVAIGLLGASTHPAAPKLSLQQTAALALSPAEGPAPRENEQHRSQLSAAVGGVSFPYWKERFGWRGSGTRSDELGGRMVRTVFYTNREGQRVGYAIASGLAPRTEGGTVVRRWGVSYRLLTHDGATVITWQRGGHLCVMAGHGVSAQTLLNLASWGGEKSHAA